MESIVEEHKFKFFFVFASFDFCFFVAYIFGDYYLLQVPERSNSLNFDAIVATHRHTHIQNAKRAWALLVEQTTIIRWSQKQWNRRPWPEPKKVIFKCNGDRLATKVFDRIHRSVHSTPFETRDSTWLGCGHTKWKRIQFHFDRAHAQKMKYVHFSGALVYDLHDRSFSFSMNRDCRTATK